jgi:hypothetical protein
MPPRPRARLGGAGGGWQSECHIHLAGYDKLFGLPNPKITTI